MAAASRQDRAQLTDRDRRILSFCAEHRFVLAPHVALLFDSSVAAASRRLATLAGAGYLNRERRYRAEPHAYWVTRSGLGAAGSDLGSPRALDPALYAHDVGVAWLAAAAHRGAFGELVRITCERRMRSEDRRAAEPEARHGIRCAAAGGWSQGRGPGLHYPDLVVVTASGQQVALELERSVKGIARRERILSAYACDPRLDAVVYLVETEAARRALLGSARRVGLDDRLRVHSYRWAGGREPGTAPAPRRARDALPASAGTPRRSAVAGR